MNRIKTFINNKFPKVWNRYANADNEYGLSLKTGIIISYGINVIVTGLIIWYVITSRNFLSYGLVSALIMYYVSWLIKEIKRPYRE